MGEITDALRRHRHGSDAARPPARIETPPPSQALASETGAASSAEISRTARSPWIERAVIVPEQQRVAESFRHFALQVRPLIERLHNRTVLITSSLRLEGKTTTSCNLALALASLAAERRIALVDLDLRRPGIVRALGLHPTVGIEQVLSGGASVAEARIHTDVAALDLFAAAAPTSRAHELLSGRRLPQLLEELGRGYDIVVIDSPPVLLVPDPMIVVPHVGAAIAVARSGFTLRSAFREMLGRLPKERLIGCFLNDAPLLRHARNYSSYYEDAADPDAAQD